MQDIDWLEVIARKQMERTSATDEEIDPYILFYKNDKGEVFYVDNPGMEKDGPPVRYRGGLSADQLKEFVPQMKYAGVKGLLR